MDLALAYTDAHYTKTVVVDGVPIVDSGDQVGTAGAPWNVTLSGLYSIPISGTVSSYLRAEEIFHSRNPGPFDWQIPGGINYFPGDQPNPAIYVLNVRAGLTMGSLDLALFVNNALNSHPLLNKGLDVPNSPLAYFTTLTPRTVGLDVVYHFAESR